MTTADNNTQPRRARIPVLFIRPTAPFTLSWRVWRHIVIALACAIDDATCRDFVYSVRVRRFRAGDYAYAVAVLLGYPCLKRFLH